MAFTDLPDYVTGYTPGGANLGLLALGPCGAGASVNTGVINVSAFSALQVRVNEIGPQNSEVDINFYSDPAGLFPVTSALSFLKSTITTTKFVIPVMGPFFKLSVTNNSGVGITNVVPEVVGVVNASLSLLRAVGLYLPVDQQGVALGGSATVIVTPTNPFTTLTHAQPGRAKGYVTAGQACGLALQAWTGAGWDTVSAFLVNAGVNTVFEVFTPLSDWRFSITNNTVTATTFTLALVFGE